MNDVFWRVINLTLHLNRLLLLLAHSDVENPEITASQIQRNEIPLFCPHKKKWEGVRVKLNDGEKDSFKVTVTS